MNHELTMTKSSISLQPHAEDNGVSYTCQAFHPALTAPMKTSVTLNVMFPPGPPEITGYPEGQVAMMGDTVTLVCRSRGGNPLAQLTWFKNNQPVNTSHTTSTGRESMNSHTFIVDSSDNNTVYRCSANSPLISPSPMMASVKLTVIPVPPTTTTPSTTTAKVVPPTIIAPTVFSKTTTSEDSLSGKGAGDDPRKEGSRGQRSESYWDRYHGEYNIPRIIIYVASGFGSSLLLLNILLVICILKRRKKKRLEEGK